MSKLHGLCGSFRENSMLYAEAGHDRGIGSTTFSDRLRYHEFKHSVEVLCTSIVCPLQYTDLETK